MTNNKFNQRTVKIALLALVLFVSIAGIKAQSIVIEDLQPYDSELKELGKGYAFTATGKKDEDKNEDYQVRYYNTQLENEITFSFKVPNSHGERLALHNGATFLIVFEDVKDKKYVYYVYDREGNQIAKKEDFKSKSNESVPIIKYTDESGYFIFRSIKKDRWGYVVERVDKQLNTLWKYEYIPEKSYVDFILPYASQYGVALVEVVPHQKIQASVGRVVGGIDKDFFNLVMIDKESGKLTGKYNLIQSGDYLEPTSIAIDPDQSVLIGGMYFDNAREEKDNSTGTYLAKISPAGDEVFVNKLPWKDDSNNLQVFLTSGKKKKKGIKFTPKVKYHHISNVNGNYYLIGEVFQKAVSGLSIAAKLAAIADDEEGSGRSPSAVGINILDFLVLTFDENGQLVNKAKASKPKRTVYQESNSVDQGGMNQAYNLDFAFKFMTTKSQNDVGVVFLGTAIKNFIERKYFGYFGLEHSGEEIEVKKIPFNMSGKTLDGDYDLKLYPHSESKVLKYEYYADKARLFMDVLEFDN